MSNIAIRAEHLSKRYRIGSKQNHYKTLRDSLSSLFSFKKSRTQSENAIWALQDVSFEIKQGEVIGVIGRNGAGKSTLLKILSRITEPTEGFVEMQGRVASLLEVGTGFHSELTGRENIYLNAAILGMKRREIDKKFDEIVSFSEVEKFIDTPVKHYSSGMYMRLAFSVAAHLDPDILLVDEILAVGDTVFQKKCLGKINDVAHQGRTVIIVNHNMGQIRRLCGRTLWIDQGGCKKFAETEETVAAYQASVGLEKTEAGGTLNQEGFLSWRILGQDSNALDHQGNFILQIQIRIKSKVFNGQHALILKGSDGQNIGSWVKKGICLDPGNYNIEYRFNSVPIRPGVYYWYASLWDGARKVDVVHLNPELIIKTEEYNIIDENWAGILNVPCDMNIKKIVI